MERLHTRLFNEFKEDFTLEADVDVDVDAVFFTMEAGHCEILVSFFRC